MTVSGFHYKYEPFNFPPLGQSGVVNAPGAAISLPKLYVTLDLETTGLQMARNGIIQIGAWATGADEGDFRGYFLRDANPHFPTSEEYKPVRVDDQALGVNGFTRERIEKAQPLYKVVREFHGWLNKFKNNFDLIVVGQNVPFDIAWLKKDFYANGLDTDCFRRVLDNVSLGFAVFGEPMGQARLAEKLGFKNGGAHDALADAFTASRIFHALKKRLPVQGDSLKYGSAPGTVQRLLPWNEQSHKNGLGSVIHSTLFN